MLLTPIEMGLALRFERTRSRAQYPEEQLAYDGAMDAAEALAKVLMKKTLGTGADAAGVGAIYWLGMTDAKEAVLLCAPAYEPKLHTPGKDVADFANSILATETESGGSDLNLIKEAILNAIGNKSFVDVNMDSAQAGAADVFRSAPRADQANRG